MGFFSEKKLFLPIIFIAALALAFFLVGILEDPLTNLQGIFAGTYLVVSAFVYTIALAFSVPLLPFTVAPLIPFVAKIFGPGLTMILTLVGYVLGSMMAYFIAQLAGRDFVSRIFPEKRLKEYEQMYKNAKSMPEKLALRFFSPIDAWAYTAGLRGQAMPLRSFFAITLVGLLPLTFILTYSTDALKRDNDIVLFSLLFATLLIILSYIYIRFIERGEKPVTIYTHDWNFHTDDIFATAALVLMHEQMGREVKVVRTRDEVVLAKAMTSENVSDRFVVDVGHVYDPEKNLFDHHQSGGAGKRENGVPYSSIGLVWKKFGTLVAGDSDIAKTLDEKLFQDMDLIDNGKETFTPLNENLDPVIISDVFEGSLRPSWRAGREEYDAQFMVAVNFAKTIIGREISHAQDKKEKEILAEGYYHKADKKEIIITDEKLSRGLFTKFKDVLFVVSPRSIEPGSEWGLVTIPTGKDMFTPRSRFPIEWAGKQGEDLQDASGVKDATFCHHSGNFLAGAKSKEGAIKMAEIALERMKKGEEKDKSEA